MIYILGGTGFVGSAYSRLFESLSVPHRVIGRNDYKNYVGTSCDIFINANGNSVKWLADKEPMKEFDASVRSVRASLEDFRFHTYVYLSSCDVYNRFDDPTATREDAPIDLSTQTRYGFHKYLAELCVRRLATRWMIFRMGGSVGPSLRKNAIFDILNNKPLWLSSASRLQYLHVDDAAKIVWNLMGKAFSGEVFNLCGCGTITLSEVQDLASVQSVVQPNAPTVHYEINIDKLSQTIHIPDTRDTIRRYIQEFRKMVVS